MNKEKPAVQPVTEISRNWSAYLIKAQISEELAKENDLSWSDLSDEEIEEHKKSILAHFESHIYLLPTPIWLETDKVVDILRFSQDGKLIRVYPPFPVNETSETSGSFIDVNVPEGDTKIERLVPIPSSAVRGARMEHGESKETKWCRGIRIDVESGADDSSVLKLLLDHICQYTHQWWLRASGNPMQGPMRLGARITKDHSLATDIRYKGAGDIESNWYGIVQFQPTLGFGSPLDKGKWLLSAHHTSEGRNPDQGLLAFYDGMADYMAGNDQKAIIHLCIATEIMLSKHSTAVLKRQPSKLKTAIRKSQLFDEKTRIVLKKLVTDRNNVAHGREPYVIAHDSRFTMEMYIRAVANLVSQYLQSMPPGEWPQIMNLRLHKQGAAKQHST